MNGAIRKTPRRERLLVVWIVILCATAATPAQDTAASPFTLKQVGPNVWAAINNPDAKTQAFANGGFVIGDDGVAVIDTFANSEAATQLLVEIRKLTNRPVRFVINTHYHLDHVAGNRVFADAGAVVLAQRNVRRWIHSENLRLLGKEIEPEQKALIVAFWAPTAVYDGSVDLYLGSREIRVRSFPGHTGSDSVVLIPDAKTAFAGDLIEHGMLPNMIDASTRPWIETLNGFVKNEAGYTFVPGHGDVGKIQDVAAFRDYLATLRKLVASARAQGKSGQALVQAVIPTLKKSYGEWQYFEPLAERNILEVEAELSGKKSIPRPQ